MKKRRLPQIFGGRELPEGIPQPPRMVSGGKKAAILTVIVLFYGGMIALGVLNYTSDTLFTILLAAMVLLPPLLSYGLLYGLSDHIDGIFKELDKCDEEDEKDE